MALPKQRKGESDTDYAVRLEASKKRNKEYKRKYYQANREAILERGREQQRRWREANREALLESKRKYREANREILREKAREYHYANRETALERGRERYYANREAILERRRKENEAKVLAEAKGKQLKADLTRPQRPRLLTELILKVAEDFCRNHGFPLECKWDTDVLKHAAQTIRNSPELYDAANPWYGTDFLCPGLVDSTWAKGIRKTWRNKA